MERDITAQKWPRAAWGGLRAHRPKLILLREAGSPAGAAAPHAKSGDQGTVSSETEPDSSGWVPASAGLQLRDNTQALVSRPLWIWAFALYTLKWSSPG